ncbi:hypothetical protein ANCCAN_14737 [Ancylostoma caninum]|uniref:Uncharacterized protein n=1 Tax=Ancylostoma caninum TaxID=29170 RepID=A0A368G4G8_ANCCA|nr:hypothetical protein ANCCAN_14737 [Ancylostoma caninum]
MSALLQCSRVKFRRIVSLRLGNSKNSPVESTISQGNKKLDEKTTRRSAPFDTSGIMNVVS